LTVVKALARLKCWDAYVLAVLALSAGLGLFQLNWGLPNGNYSWAADALGPLTVLGIARRSLTWNSGWFYFKYPLGYPAMLLASYAPYLAVLVLTGRWRHPAVVYPYGFTHPETALYTMALIGRAVNAALAVVAVALTYGIGHRLLDRRTGLLAAWFVATAYPVVYYAHTTNLYVPSLVWASLALWSTVVATDEADRRWPYAVLGIAAAMGVSTKEQDLPFLIAPIIILVVRRRRLLPVALGRWRRWWRATWNAQMRVALSTGLVTAVIANNALMNPRGVVNRFLNLTGNKLPGVTARLTPVEFAFFKGWPKELMYGRQLVDRMESALGLPLFLVAVAGVLFVSRYRWRPAVYLLVPAFTYYYFALRTHATQIALRYAVPLLPVFAVCAAALCVAAMGGKWRRLANGCVVGLCLLSLARAVEMDLILQHDPRYSAEAWIKSNVRRGSVVEVYQKPTYLPRLAGLDVREVPLRERSIAGVEARHPDFIIISSAAKKGITDRWNPDWRRGNTLVLEEPAARAFLDALEGSRLPYSQVAHFVQRPVLLRLLVTSLCPEISIFRRVAVGDHSAS
jgi:hypothetical protein